MATAEPLPFGELLKRYRIAADLTQDALAERAGVSADTIGSLERGINHVPRKDTARLLAEALGLAPHERVAFDIAAQRRITPVLSLPAPDPRIAAESELPRFVGRSRELSLVERFLRGAGRPVMLVSGEPGIGKSRLLHEAAALARNAGWAVLEGGCQRRGGQEPYAPLLGALQRYKRHQSPAQLRSDLRGCTWLVRLLPELAEESLVPLPRWTLPPKQEYGLMFAAVGRFLANIAGPAGTLLILDDLQWANADALDLIVYLIRSAGGPAIRVLGTYRSTEFESQAPLAATVDELVRDDLATQISLLPLALDDAANLLHAMLEGVERTEDFARRVIQRAGGVPFFLVSCARALRDGAMGERNGDAVPWDVTQAIRQREVVLPPLAQRLLGIAAVVGRVVQGSLLIQLAAEPEAAVLAALAACCQARLLEEQGEDAYHFPHDIIREVVEADLSGGQRRLLHRQIAEALERGRVPAPQERLAYHFSRGGDLENAARYLKLAGDRALASHAHAEAEGYYRELVERRDSLAQPLPAAAAQETLSDILVIQSSYTEALEVLNQAATVYRAHGDVEGLGRATTQIGWVHARRGTAEEGIRRLREVLDATAAHEISAKCRAGMYVALAQLHNNLDQYNELLEAVARAAELARMAGDERLLGKAELRRAGVLVQLGHVEEGFQTIAVALPLLERTNDLWGVAHALNLMAMTHSTRGEFDAAGVLAERALATARRLGDPQVIAFMAYRHGIQNFYTERWHDAHAAMEEAVETTRQLATSAIASYPLFGLGRLCQVTGQYGIAAQYLNEAGALAVKSRDLQAQRLIQRALAEQDLFEGRPDAARTRLMPLLDQNGHEERNVTMILPYVAWAHLELGEARAAARFAEQGVARATREQNRLTLVDALRLQGLVASRLGDWHGATRALEDALALSRAMPYPYAEAKALYLLGRLRAEHGERHQGRQHLEAALAILGRLGERLYAERAERTLAAL